jgi:hypothetical protein
MQRMKTYHASITVEAAFVMPIVILTVFTLLYLTFYLHDMCKVQGIVDETLHLAGLSMKYEDDPATVEIDYKDIIRRGVFDELLGDRSEAERKIEAYLQHRLAKGLFLSHITGIQAEVGRVKLEVSVESEGLISIPWVELFFKNYSHTVTSGEYPIHDPARTIRVCEVILDTASQVKGVDELKKKMEHFFPNEKNE